MFIPYRAKIRITRVPVMTILVTVICLLVYWAQERSREGVIQSAEHFCAGDVARDVGRGQALAFPTSDYDCTAVLTHIYLRGDSERHLAWHVERIEGAGDRELAQQLVRHYREFAAQAPADLTSRLTHRSGSWNPLRLLSATIAHGSWDHVIGNLFFFVAFAMVVEAVIGPVLFLIVFLAMGLGAGALENLLTVTREGAQSLGLSGVVMSMLALAAYLAPKVKIKFFYFYFLFFGVMSWPLWSVAAWYVFWNLWDYHFWRDWSMVSYVGHLTGAATGLILGVGLFRSKRHWVQEELVVDEPMFTDEESWLYKLNVFSTTPVVMYFVFVYGLGALTLGLYLFVTFIQTFAAQLLIAAPVVAGIVQIYRMRKAPRPVRLHVADARRLIAQHKFEQAEKILKPLAESNDARAQYALAAMYATGSMAIRNIPEAIHWFEEAARRGNAEALCELGSRYYHGIGVVKDLDRAIRFLEQAGQKGLAEAAATLGHIYENGPKDRTDKDKAIEWYYKAGVSYIKVGRYDDAQSIVKMLKNVSNKYPAVYQLVTELEKLATIKGGSLKRLEGA